MEKYKNRVQNLKDYDTLLERHQVGGCRMFTIFVCTV